MTLILFYIALLSEWIPLVLCIYFYKIICKEIKKTLLIWFAIKCLADLISLIAYKIFNVNFFPVFHISVLIENILMFIYISYFFYLNRLKKYVLYSLPIFIFGCEIFLGSFFELNKISILTYNGSVSILLLISILQIKKIEKIEFSFILSLFLFHCISFVYFVFDRFRRYNDYINENIYPVYIVFVVFFNLHFLYFIWSKRKK